MSKDELAAEWKRISHDWISAVGSAGDSVRAGLLDDWMLDVVGAVDGLDVIDLGCGDGRFCRMLAARGARPTGIDLQPAFVEHATAHGGSDQRYVVADMETLDVIEDASFDLAVSYITLVDVADMDAAIRQAWRVLRPGGRFVVCNLSPLTTASRRVGWIRDGEGTKLHYPLDDYSDEGPRTIPFVGGAEITNFHRMFSTTVNSFLDAGFAFQRLHEPVPDDGQLERLGDDDLRRAPGFVIYDLAKPR